MIFCSQRTLVEQSREKNKGNAGGYTSSSSANSEETVRLYDGSSQNESSNSNFWSLVDDKHKENDYDKEFEIKRNIKQNNTATKKLEVKLKKKNSIYVSNEEEVQRRLNTTSKFKRRYRAHKYYQKKQTKLIKFHTYLTYKISLFVMRLRITIQMVELSNFFNTVKFLCLSHLNNRDYLSSREEIDKGACFVVQNTYLG